MPVMNRLPVICAGAALTLAACAGDREDGERRGRDLAAAHLDFARCMRANDVPVADPPAGGTIPEPSPAQRRAWTRHERRAVARCEPILAAAARAGAGDGGSGTELDTALRFARCMRRHGIALPDPRREGDDVSLRLPDRYSLADPRVRRTHERCARGLDLPELPR